MDNIILIGFMGTGKSTLGRLLSEKLGFPFIDLDDKIEQDVGRSIPEMFEQEGEAYFRAREKEAVRDVCRLSGYVIATGGGTPVDEENAAMLSKSGMVVSLSADADTLVGRTQKKGERPVLDGAEEDSRKKAVESLLSARQEAYRRAHLFIDTGRLLPEEAADRIIEGFEERRKRDA